MKKEKLKFCKETINRDCEYCPEKSVGTVGGKEGDFNYLIPHCSSHKRRAKKKVLEHIRGGRRIAY